MIEKLNSTPDNQNKSLISAPLALLRRDLKVAFRHLNELSHPLIFFLIVVSLFPMAVSPDPAFLREIAPGVIWIAALLACLLSLDSIFRTEYEDGTLELMVISSQSLSLMVLSKVTAHWLVSGLPLTIIALLLGYIMNLPNHSYMVLLISLALGTPTMSIIGAIGAALTVGLRRSGLLLTLIIMPLYIPILIFGTSAIQSSVLDLPYLGQLYFLAAILVLGLALAPLAVALAIKISLN